MTQSTGHRKRRQDGQFHFDEGDQMPYRWPRGTVVGSRRGQYIAAAVCIVLLVGFFVLVAYMAHWRWH